MFCNYHYNNFENHTLMILNKILFLPYSCTTHTYSISVSSTFLILDEYTLKKCKKSFLSFYNKGV